MTERHASPATEIAWAAGLFDGEGSTWLKPARAQTKANMVMGVTQNHPEVLERFVAAVAPDVRVLGPYDRAAGRNPYWALQVFGLPRCREVFDRLHPYLGSVKIAQFERVEADLRECRDDFHRLGGEECRRGHRDWTETPRGRICRTCRNAANRASRARRSA